MSKTVKKFKTENINHSKKAKKTNKPILLADWGARVAKIAYDKEKNRSFLSGHALDEWLERENESSFL